MADHPHDSPEYRSASARAVRAMDGGQALLQEYARHMSGNKGLPGLAARAAVYCGATFTVAALYAAVTAPDSNQHIPRDGDLSGKALLNRTYAYQSDGVSQNSAYLLVNDRGRYELYQWIESRNRSELVTDFNIAHQIVRDMGALSQRTLETEDFSATDKKKIRMYGCDTLFEAATDGDVVYRAEESCPSYEGDGPQIKTQYERASAFWADAATHMNEANYGPAQNEIHQIQQVEDSGVLETGGSAALLGFGVWAGLAGLGTAGANIRRRAARKPTR